MKALRYFLALLLSTGLVLAPVSTAHAGLESATYINGLVATNPTAGDPVAQGDDHTRLLKSTLLATFPNITGAVTPTHTELNYVDGVTSAIQTQLDQAKLTSGTAVASTSGTSIDFTSIPSWVKRVTITFAGVSTNGTSNPLIQIGDSGGVETSGYLGAGTSISNLVSPDVLNYTSGWGIPSGLAANVFHGSVTISLLDASTNTWVCSGLLGVSSGAAVFGVGGSKALSATLDRVRLTTVGGANTFDAGTVNILYE